MNKKQGLIILVSLITILLVDTLFYSYFNWILAAFISTIINIVIIKLGIDLMMKYD